MPRATDGPKSPSPEEIDGFVDFLNAEIGKLETAPILSEAITREIAALQRLIEILDWALEQVNKRRLYSKKFQLKDKERTRLLKERLGDDYASVIDDAKRAAEQQLKDVVANEEPNEHEIDEILRDARNEAANLASGSKKAN